MTIRPSDSPAENSKHQLAFLFLEVNPHNNTTPFKTHIMLIEAEMVYPTAVPNKFAYWTHPHNVAFILPAKSKNFLFSKNMESQFLVILIYTFFGKYNEKTLQDYHNWVELDPYQDEIERNASRYSFYSQ